MSPFAPALLYGTARPEGCPEAQRSPKPVGSAILRPVGDPKIGAIRRAPWLAGCGDKELELIASCTDEVDVKAGRTLVHQLAPGGIFVITKGEADRCLGAGGRQIRRAPA